MTINLEKDMFEYLEDKKISKSLLFSIVFGVILSIVYFALYPRYALKIDWVMPILMIVFPTLLLIGIISGFHIGLKKGIDRVVFRFSGDNLIYDIQSKGKGSMPLSTVTHITIKRAGNQRFVPGILVSFWGEYEDAPLLEFRVVGNNFISPFESFLGEGLKRSGILLEESSCYGYADYILKRADIAAEVPEKAFADARSRATALLSAGKSKSEARKILESEGFSKRTISYAFSEREIPDVPSSYSEKKAMRERSSQTFWLVVTLIGAIISASIWFFVVPVDCPDLADALRLSLINHIKTGDYEFVIENLCSDTYDLAYYLGVSEDRITSGLFEHSVGRKVDLCFYCYENSPVCSKIDFARTDQDFVASNNSCMTSFKTDKPGNRGMGFKVYVKCEEMVNTSLLCRLGFG